MAVVIGEFEVLADSAPPAPAAARDAAGQADAAATPAPPDVHAVQQALLQAIDRALRLWAD